MATKTTTRPFAHIPTDKLKFVLGVGEAGLTMWRGRKLAEVKQRVEEMKAELKLRNAK